MPPVVIYTRAYCSYCDWAKELLERKGVAFTEIDVTGNRDRRAEMVERASGRSTTPQILVYGASTGRHQKSRHPAKPIANGSTRSAGAATIVIGDVLGRTARAAPSAIAEQPSIGSA